MKISRWIIGVAVTAVTLLSGCNKKEEVITDIIVSVDPTTLTIDKAAQDKAISLKATRAWKAEISYEGDAKDWLSLSATTGTASRDAQALTITAKENTGRDRVAKVKFSIGLDDATLTVTQSGPGGSADPVYFNNFDKSAAVQSSSKWPYVSDSDCWRNEKGTGIAGISYILTNNKATIRNNSNSTGSGVNNWFFGADARFCVKGIALPEGQTNYSISFYGIRNVYGTTAGEGKSVFDHNVFKLYVSNDGSKWVEVAYVFEGGDPDAAWGQATASFTVPSGTKTLCFGVPCPSESSVYRIDDVKLDVAEAAGTAVDFTKGIEISEFTEGGGPKTGEPKGTGTEADPFNPTAAIAKAKEIGTTASTEYYYIKGYVSSIKDISTSYGNGTFYVTDTKDYDTESFCCFRVKYIGGSKFTSTDQIKVGDEVVVKAQLINYMGNTPETNNGEIVSINGKTDAGPQFGVGTKSINVAYTSTIASLKITGNVAWTVSCDNSYFHINHTSGTGEEEILIAFTANKEYTAKTGKITVSTTNTEVATKSYEVTITQAGAPDPSATYVELTNAEIQAALVNYLPSSATTAYTDVEISSASGKWTGNIGVGKDQDGKLSTPYIQIRAKSGAKVVSPAFGKDIEKIVLAINAQTVVRTFYAMPSSTEVPTSGDYPASLFDTNCGSAASTGKVAEEITINVTGSQQSFILLVKGGAAYIDSIKVYLKK